MLQVVLMSLTFAFLAPNEAVPFRLQFPRLSEQIPQFEERLTSSHWQVRYGLLGELEQNNTETKRALEWLVRDANQQVANQALVRYVKGFVYVDKSLFKPTLYLPHRWKRQSQERCPAARVLVEYCLGRKLSAKKRRIVHQCIDARITPLNPDTLNDPKSHNSLTIVGILGRREDAPALYPYLKSQNDYVLLGAAKALIRLGDREKGVEGLMRLIDQDPKEHLYYMTAALQVLREMKHPQLKPAVQQALAIFKRTPGVQPNWYSGFVRLAAEVVGDEVW